VLAQYKTSEKINKITVFGCCKIQMNFEWKYTIKGSITPWLYQSPDGEISCYGIAGSRQ
jgi:hypothetical protein